MTALAAAAICGASVFAGQARVGHTASLLYNDKVLIAGGDLGLGPVNTTEILDEQAGTETAGPSMSVARSSHTATVLADGRVLVYGGLTNAATLVSAANVAEIYNPYTNTWSGPFAGPAGSAARYNHTATLLQNGKVLICGGQADADGTADFLSTCLLFDPSNPSGFSGATPISMLSSSSGGRALHTATLIKDGRVFLAGGYSHLAGIANPYTPLVTTEIYNPTTNGFTPGKALIRARAHHQATMLADGRILISGGEDGKDVYASKGYIESAEIYDPLSDSIQAAQPMEERKAFQTTTLGADGRVFAFGGLGNITTSYATLGAVGSALQPGSILKGVRSATSSGTITTAASSLYINLDIPLSVEASGIIKDGEIDFSSPQASVPLGKAEFDPGIQGGAAPYPNGQGLKFDLAGTEVTCLADGSKCGIINPTAPVSLQNVMGTYEFQQQTFSMVSSLTAGSCIEFAAAGLDTSDSPLSILNGSGGCSYTGDTGSLPATDVSYACGQFKVTLDPAFSGATVLDLEMALKSGSWTFQKSNGVNFTASLDGGKASLVGGDLSPGTVGSDGVFDLFGCFHNLTGGISDDTDTAHAQAPPASGNGTLSAGGTMQFVVSQIDMSGQSFSIDIATIQIREMVFGDFECYDEKTNSWSMDPSACADRSSGYERFGQTATLLPNNDIEYYGGQVCSAAAGPSCSAYTPTQINPLISSTTLLSFLTGGWTTVSGMSQARGNHTTTLLPDGRMLIAGGTDGQTTLSSSELFDPTAKTFSPAATMNVSRDLHTASLLTNGRVLVAGGFHSGLPSTGTTNSAEIYDPAVNAWVQTGALNQGRDNHTATVMPDGNIMVVGGYVEPPDPNAGYLDTAEVYYSTAGVWHTAAAPMGTKRALHAAVLLQDGRLLVIGGVNASGPTASVEAYDPAAGTWTPQDSLPVALHSPSAVLLPDGLVLVAGGDDGFGEKDTSYTFDPNAVAGKQWTKRRNMSQARINGTLTLLPNGLVLAAGGAQANGNTIGGAEEFHPSSGKWLSISTFTSARAYHTVTVAPDGTMYAIGGYDGSKYLDTAESLFFTGSFDQDSSVSPSIRQSSITALDYPVIRRGQETTLTGRNFKGNVEASGGGAANNSDHNKPRVTLQALDESSGGSTQGTGGFMIDLSSEVYGDVAYGATGDNDWSNMDSSITFIAPNTAAGLPYGWYHLRTISNAVYSTSKIVQAGPSLPSTGVTNIVPNPNPPNSATSVTWNWNAPVSGTYDGYNVYSATTGILLSQVGEPAPQPAVGSFVESSLTPNTTVQIVVAPYSLSGDGPLATSATYFTLAAVPGAPQIASVTFDSLMLQWDTSGNSVGTVYEVLMSTVDALSYGPAISTPVPELVGLTTDWVIISPLQPRTTYWLSVRAYNGAGTPTNWATPVSSAETRIGIDTLAGAPISATSIGWSWTDGNINAATGEHYNVYDATNGVVIASTANPSFIDVGLGTNTPRCLMVSAVTHTGPNGTLAEGPLTPGVTVFTLAAVPLPSAPAFFNVSTGGFTAEWTPNGNPTGTQYQCVVTELASGTGVTSSTTSTTGFVCDVTGTSPPASIFDVRVRAVNSAGVPTDVSNFSNILALGTTSTLANPPLNLVLLNTTPSSISASWSSNNNSSSATYEVTYTTDNFLTDVKYALPFSRRSNQTSITIGSLLTSTTYSIRVRAQNAYGVPTLYSNVLTTGTFNGGAPAGSLGGFVPANSQVTISGSLGNGRQVSLFIPGGTFTVDTFVAISSFDTTQPGSNVCGGAPIGVSFQTVPAVEPLKPVYLTLSYDPSELPPITDVNQAALERWDPTAGHCVPLSTTFDTSARTFTAELNHFSTFQLAQVAPAVSPDFTVIYPNPFYPTQGNGYVTFQNMPKQAHVRLFTLKGEDLWDGYANDSGLLTWTGVNHAGRPAASGVYLAVVDDGSKTHVYKVAIVR